MKEYIQGLITGGVLVFTSLVLIGAQQKSPNIHAQGLGPISINLTGGRSP